MEETVEHWWNGIYGRLARYDLWLKRWTGPAKTTWRVEAERGGQDGQFWASPDIDDEADARAMLERIRARRETSATNWQRMDR